MLTRAHASRASLPMWAARRTVEERGPQACPASVDHGRSIRLDAARPGGDHAGQRLPRQACLKSELRLDDEAGLVGARGFEPPTSSSRTMRATKLRHAPTESAPEGRGMIAHRLWFLARARGRGT